MTLIDDIKRDQKTGRADWFWDATPAEIKAALLAAEELAEALTARIDCGEAHIMDSSDEYRRRIDANDLVHSALAAYRKATEQS